ncbi:glycosyltransferase family 39 protein [Paenibacillus sp. FSL K6-3182]|uniref:glycosyltransferase family 39 protein n=1 Tax=Paenibacillus sp. FSL K6-3182 TaxID=2921495 RepID=UPI0030CFD5CE
MSKVKYVFVIMIFLSCYLHMYFLYHNPGQSFNNPEVYDASLTEVYGDKVLKYGSFDAVYYSITAEQLLSKGFLGFASTAPNAYVTPGQPVYLAIIFGIADLTGGDHLLFAKIANMLLSIATSVLMFYIGFNIFGKIWVGFLSGFGYMLYFPQYHYFRALLTEIPAIFLFCLSLLLFVLAIKKNNAKYHILFGIIFSILLMFRPSPAPLVLIGIGIIVYNNSVKNSLRIAILWLIGPILIIAPWVVRNLIVLNEFILFSSQENPLFAGTNPFELEDYGEMMNKANEMGISQKEAAHLRIEEGFRSHPALWISWYVFGKTIYLFQRPSAISLYMNNNSFFVKPIYLYHYMTIISAIFATVIFRKRGSVFCLSLMIIMYIAVSNVFIVNDRYGFFIMPIFILLGSYMIYISVKHYKDFISSLSKHFKARLKWD